MKVFKGNEITINEDGSHATNWKHPDMHIHVHDSEENESWKGYSQNDIKKLNE